MKFTVDFSILLSYNVIILLNLWYRKVKGLKNSPYATVERFVDRLLLGKETDCEAIRKYEIYLTYDNIINMSMYCKALILVLFMCMVFRSILHGVNEVNTVPFAIATMITLVIMFFLKKYIDPQNHTVKTSRILTYAYSINICAIAMYYDLILQSEEYDVFLLIVIVVLSGMFNKHPCEHLVFLICLLGILIVIEARLAPSKIFLTDLFNAIIAAAAGIFLAVAEMRTKIELIMIKENEHKIKMSDIKTQIVLNQIKPHFLYNVLATIQVLCKFDPDKAVTAMEDFSGYLRANVDYGLSKSVVSFDEEFKNVKYFLRLEKLRCGDKLKIVYELKEKNFEIPVLTLQPIVENAVKHGVGNKKGGGTVTISTSSDDNNIIIRVQDDGDGISAKSIDELSLSYDGKSHVGLTNVKERIEIITGGSLDFYSEKGKGTVVTIKIPKDFKEATYEYTRS